jgi:uncharacterized protein YciI
MFVILLDYVRPLEDVDSHLVAHRQFLREHYASGHLLMSGPKQPRTGGVIVCAAASRTEAEALVARDPFHVHGIANYQIIEFDVTSAASELVRFVTPFGGAQATQGNAS